MDANSLVDGASIMRPPIIHRTFAMARCVRPKVTLGERLTSALRIPVCASVANMARSDAYRGDAQ